uniref:Putative secreted protein n=1 Tax=Panstrongylus lignarius TaxID=156445 RepID=A0A224XMT9_9HEMI
MPLYLSIIFNILIYCTLGEITSEDKMGMQSKFASMENELNNLFQQTVSEVRNTVDGRVIQYKGRDDYRKAMCAEQLGRTLSVDVELRGRVDLVGLAGYFKTRREIIISPATSQNELEATRVAVDNGSVTRQMQDNINKFKKFVSQKMLEYQENTTKC